MAAETGQRLFQQAEILLCLFLCQQTEGLLKRRDDLLVCIDIASVNVMDGIVFRTDAAADLAEFFLIHGIRVSPCKNTLRQTPGFRCRVKAI